MIFENFCFRGKSQIDFNFIYRHLALKIQTHTPTMLKKMPKIDETVFPIDICIFIWFGLYQATGVSERRTSQFLAWNVFLLLKRRVFPKGVAGKKLIPTLEIGPRTLTLYLFSLLGAEYV